MIKLDKITYSTLVLALFNCYTGEYNDMDKALVQQFEQLDKKYKSTRGGGIDELDLPVFINALEQLLVKRNDWDILQVERSEGLKLLDLLRQSKQEIKASDWS